MHSPKLRAYGYSSNGVLFLLTVLLLLIFPAVASAASSSIVISQVYGEGGGTGASYQAGYIELFNRGTSAVSIDGWSVQYSPELSTTWSKTDLAGTIQPGQYFLIREASGGSNGAPLPAPDLTGSIVISFSNGRVVIVPSQTLLAGYCPGNPTVDALGYGPSTTCGEISAFHFSSSNTTAFHRWDFGCLDTDNNNNDFAVGTPTPRNSSSTFHLCPGVAPVQVVVDPNGNRVIEPGETVTVEPSWINNIGFSLDAVGGTASNFTGPAGATYTITDSVANYGSAAQGATVHCASMLNCYSFSVSNPSTRPAQHWDVTFTETLTTTPDSWTTPHTWTLHIGNSFLDVPTTNIFYRFVETLFHNNITAGCGSGNYCPGNSITRAQMAVFLLEAEHGPTYQPPPATGTVFNDVPIGSFAASFIEQLYAEGVTAGCGNGNYCPGNPVTRAQMAVFLLKTRNGAAWNPPPATGTMFNDVPLGSFAAAFIEELAREGITAGCGNGNYCPTNPNTRGQMAPFITVTFGLTQ